MGVVAAKLCTAEETVDQGCRVGKVNIHGTSGLARPSVNVDSEGTKEFHMTFQ